MNKLMRKALAAERIRKQRERRKAEAGRQSLENRVAASAREANDLRRKLAAALMMPSGSPGAVIEHVIGEVARARIEDMLGSRQYTQVLRHLREATEGVYANFPVDPASGCLRVEVELPARRMTHVLF